MIHLILLFICSLSVEIIIRSNYPTLISSTIELSKKAINIITNKNISDHWKENIIPKYSWMMMKLSIQMLLIFLAIIFIFLCVDKIFSGFLTMIFSWNGLIESILFAFGYAYTRKIFLK